MILKAAAAKGNLKAYCVFFFREGNFILCTLSIVYHAFLHSQGLKALSFPAGQARTKHRLAPMPHEPIY